MTASARVQSHLASQGLRALVPSAALAAFGRALRSVAAHSQTTPPRLGICSIDWPAYTSAHAGERLPTALTRAEFCHASHPAHLSTAPAFKPVESLFARYRKAPASQRRRIVLDYVRDQALKLLGLDPAFELSPQGALRDLGLDSLMAVELRNLLAKNLGVDKPLPATLAFDYPTPEAIQQFLEKILSSALDLDPSGSTGAPVDGPTPTGSLLQDSQTAAGSATALGQKSMLDTVNEISEAEAEAMLLAELKNLRNEN
jgi:acyl carrier protein